MKLEPLKRLTDPKLKSLLAQSRTSEEAVYCPFNDAECRCGEFCIASVWSTPKNAGNHARQLKRVVGNCTTRQRRSSVAEDEHDED